MNTLGDETTAKLPSSVRWLVTWYGATIFLSSAILLVLEIVAGRLIAPYVGVSIYSWTSIIGVILAGLSLGNWMGGRWADRQGGEKAVGLVLVLAAIFCIVSLFMLTIVAPVLKGSELDLISASFIYVLSMFFIPAVLLGVVTPLLTTLALGLDKRIGHIVGRMHALAALGSILGTFITGYWLVQYFGSRTVVVASAVCLLLLAIPYLRKLTLKTTTTLVIALMATILLTQMRDGFSSPCHWESSYFCLRVEDASSSEYGSAKALILDHLLHGINHEDEPDLLISPYVHLMDELVRTYMGDVVDSGLSYFFAGGGAYTQPRAVRAMYPNAKVTVAELDPQVTATAKAALYLDASGMDIYHTDARVVLSHSQQQYDVVITDVFHDISVPYHMITREFAQAVKQNMREEGIYLMNIIDQFPDPQLVKSLLKTLKTEFRHVGIWLERPPDKVTRVTYVISASNDHPFPDVVYSSNGFDRRWLKINKPLLMAGTSLDDLPVLTDDYVPVERLLANLLFSKEAL
ncbi:fused MFS/spermidine synthase [Kaarinaea lacus]